MRFLADENFPRASIVRLRAENHDVLAAAEDFAGQSDESVLARASKEQRVLLTFDRDYGNLIFRARLTPPAGVIYLRFEPQFPQEPAEVVLALLSSSIRILGRYAVVEPPRIRLRDMPDTR